MKYLLSNFDTFSAGTVRVMMEIDLSSAEEATEFLQRVHTHVLDPLNLS